MTEPRPVPFQRPTFPAADRIEHYFERSRDRRWFSNRGPCLELLTERLGARTGAVCLPVASGTLGLLVAVAGVRRAGTTALVPSFTFPATAQALIWNDLQPVFVDIDAEHWHLSPRALEQALAEGGDDVALVVACSAFGTPPPPAVREAWADACRAAGVPLLVDSAAGFGAIAEDGVPIGAQGTAEVVSFHATKPLAIGEGGAIFSRDDALVARMARLANFGFDANRHPIERRGINAKLDELHAATALAALDDLDAQLTARHVRACRMREGLGAQLVPQLGHEHSTVQFVSLLARDRAARNRMFERADGRIEIRSYYEPLHRAPAFADLPRVADLAVTDDIGGRIVSLPMAVDLTDSEIAEIVDVVAGDAR
ncbi:MAG TPA: aminotransferase class I/II-fold pyridoxal phosphate-dependent enzyme [Acidimicrobiia bacterium]|nr:aminotransferase class I/II-fold pyridoxal phosphate-dependent enzyme [Acidimicrobiia bacterium]